MRKLLLEIGGAKVEATVLEDSAPTNTATSGPQGFMGMCRNTELKCPGVRFVSFGKLDKEAFARFTDECRVRCNTCKFSLVGKVTAENENTAQILNDLVIGEFPRAKG